MYLFLLILKFNRIPNRFCHWGQVRGIPLSEIIIGDVERAEWHAQLRSYAGVGNIEVVDGQATASMVDLARAHALFARVGENTVAAFIETTLLLYMSSRGRDVRANRISVDECISIDAKCLAQLERWQVYARIKGCDAGTSTLRGGQTEQNIAAIGHAINGWARFVKMNVKVGLSRMRIRADKVMSCWNEYLNSRLKYKSNCIELHPTLVRGATIQQSALLRSDARAFFSVTGRRGRWNATYLTDDKIAARVTDIEKGLSCSRERKRLVTLVRKPRKGS